MRRLVVQPRIFGTVNGYEWDADSNPQPHNDYCTLYSNEYSVRVWEPTRMRTSLPGVEGEAGTAYEAVPLPVKAHIRGIKGDAWFRFDGTEQGVGTWLYADGVGAGTPLNPQPSALDTFNALAGNPWVQLVPDVTYYDRNPGFYCPLFCAMYRGTFKSVDSSPGWEIDSGPGDDPDVLLPLDITSPDVLESGRLDWWALDQVRFPHARHAVDWGTELITMTQPPSGGSHHRFALNLEQNKRLGADQVLWLHWKTGVVRLPVKYTPPAGGGDPEVICALYVNHRFNVHVQATMLVDTAVSVG